MRHKHSYTKKMEEIERKSQAIFFVLCALFIIGFFLVDNFTGFSIGGGTVSAVPSVPQLNLPENLTNHSITPIFNWSNATDTDNHAITYILEIDNNSDFSSAEYFNGTISETSNVTSAVGVNLSADGTYYWHVRATDGTSNTSFSGVRQFVLDTTFPLISFTNGSEANGSSFDRDWVFTNVTLTETNEKNITFVLLNLTNTLNSTSFDAGGRSLNFTKLSRNAAYIYNVSVEDHAGNINSTGIRMIFLDNQTPTVTVVGPLNNSGNTDENVPFVLTVSDLSSVNCSLYLDNVLNVTHGMNRSSEESLNVSSISQGSHSYFLSCTDQVNLQVNSSIRNFTVFGISNFTGSATTNLRSANLSNISNFILEISNKGKINFTQTVNITGGHDFDQFIKIQDNFIELDSGNLNLLNISAELTLYNLSFTNPRILRNNGACASSTCTKLRYDVVSGELTFNVSSFTNYSSEDTPTSGSTGTTGTSGGSGGGGGKTTSRQIALNLIQPGPISLYSNESVIVPILLENSGDTDLLGILLEATSDNPDLLIEIEPLDLPVVSAKESRSVNLFIRSKAGGNVSLGEHEITIKASATNPKYTDITKFFINLIDFGFGDRDAAVEQIRLAKDFFSGRGACSELSKYIKQAEEALANDEIGKAIALARSASESCKELVNVPQKEIKPLQDQSNLLIILVESVAFIIFISLIYSYYRKRKMRLAAARYRRKR